MTWFDGHLLDIVMFAVAYILLGSLWGLAKWWFYLHNRADDYERLRVGYQATYKEAITPPDEPISTGKTDTNAKVNERKYLKERAETNLQQWPTFKDYLKDKYDLPPSPLKNKSRITMWMVYWPWSALWTLLNDPIKRIYRAIYDALTATYQRMSSAVFAGRFTELK